MAFELEEIVPWGRTRCEYELMFNLRGGEFHQSILGCGDGPASFNAEMTRDGYSVTSIDPIYEFSAAQIRQRFDDVADRMIEQVRESPACWDWGFHGNEEGLLAHRLAAIERFSADFELGRAAGRYVVGGLPQLPWPDGEFGLALCSHLLFLYSDLLDERFHMDAVVELCRVAREVRIFPLLTLAQTRSPHLPVVQSRLYDLGFESRVETTGYEFQKGGNQMLRIVAA